MYDLSVIIDWFLLIVVMVSVVQDGCNLMKLFVCFLDLRGCDFVLVSLRFDHFGDIDVMFMSFFLFYDLMLPMLSFVDQVKIG